MDSKLSSEVLEILREIGERSLDGVVVYYIPDDKIIYSNAIAQTMVEFDPLEINSVDQFMLRLDPKGRSYILKRFQRAKDAEKVTEIEFGLIRNNKKIRFVSCRLYFLRQRSIVVGTMQDITQSKRYQRHLRELGMKRNAMLDTVLHFVSGTLYLMKNLGVEAEKNMKSNDQKSASSVLKMMNGNTDDSIGMINTFLGRNRDYTNVESESEIIDLVEAMMSMVATLKKSNSGKNFRFDPASQHCFVKTDGTKLFQIISNFVTNSVKFTPDNGQITLDIEKKEGRVIVSVIDNGVGIPHSQRFLLFDRHTSASRSGLKGEASNGIGLSISKRLAEQINAEISFSSRINEGSVFRVSLRQSPDGDRIP